MFLLRWFINENLLALANFPTLVESWELQFQRKNTTRIFMSDHSALFFNSFKTCFEPVSLFSKV